MKEAIEADASLEELFDNHFSSMVRYPKGINEYRELKQKKRSWVTVSELHYGLPGTGKTSTVDQKYPGAYWWSPGKWADGYAGEEVVVLDEFKGWMPYSVLCKLIDSSPFKVEVKGGYRNFVAKRVVIISNYPPGSWYTDAGLNLMALYRRLEAGEMYLHKKQSEDINNNSKYEEPTRYHTVDELPNVNFQEHSPAVPGVLV